MVTTVMNVVFAMIVVSCRMRVAFRLGYRWWGGSLDLDEGRFVMSNGLSVC